MRCTILVDVTHLTDVKTIMVMRQNDESVANQDLVVESKGSKIRICKIRNQSIPPMSNEGWQ